MNGTSPPAPGNRPPVPHLCFSHNLSCSGCRPCPKCLEVVRTYVLPPAMAAAGFAGSQEQALAFFRAYTQQGWPALMQQMIQGQLQGQFQIADIASLMAELEMHRAEARAREQALIMAAPSPPGSSSQIVLPLVDPYAPTLNAALAPAPTADGGGDRVRGGALASGRGSRTGIACGWRHLVRQRDDGAGGHGASSGPTGWEVKRVQVAAITSAMAALAGPVLPFGWSSRRPVPPPLIPEEFERQETSEAETLRAAEEKRARKAAKRTADAAKAGHAKPARVPA